MPNNLTDAEETRLLDLGLVDGDKLALVSVAGTDAVAGTEVAGGTYARQTIDWAAAASGVKATAAAIAFTGLPATEVQGWAVYDSTGATRKWYGLWSRVLATATGSTDLINATAHGRANGDKIVFGAGYVPAGLTAGVTYFVRDVATNTFKVAASLGGAALDITADSALVVFGRVYDVASGGGFSIASGALTCSLT